MRRWRSVRLPVSAQLDGHSGTLLVTAVSENERGFWRWGRLEHPGTAANRLRYLKFRDGPYWLKAGCDDPENFLGRYRHYDAPAKRRAAVDYLAARGVNSMYIMTHNVQGDDNDVWPWLGDTPGQARAHGGRQARFDVAKLEAWRDLFEYMQTAGVVPYLVLEDDSAWKGYDHRRYYREMIARFGYLPALLINLGEEHNENYSLDEALAYMQLWADSDPYDHPRGIHNVNRPRDDYVDADWIDFTAIQTGSPGTRRGLARAVEHNRLVRDWIDLCQRRGKRVLMVGVDEGRPEEDRRAWWSAYLGGGVWEAHVLEPYDRPMSAWETVWNQLGGARAFMERFPFWEMQPRNDLVLSGQAFCLAQPPTHYALYLPAGGSITVRLAADARYVYSWWNPAGGAEQARQLEQHGPLPGGEQQFVAPADGDWALSIRQRAAPN